MYNEKHEIYRTIHTYHILKGYMHYSMRIKLTMYDFPYLWVYTHKKSCINNAIVHVTCIM